jgi:serine/threonine protein phosphatase PrpC
VRLVVASGTDVGRVRSSNQDSLYADERILVVADGMGGHAGGEVASRVAVREIVAALRRGQPPGDAIRDANSSILHEALSDAGLEGMGTTLTLAVIDLEQRRAEVFNVGDSRAYLFREGVLTQITSDHTFVQELVDAGSITEEQAATHRARHVLTRALGVALDVEPDRFVVPLAAEDQLLLCSDGLINEVDGCEIAAVLDACEPDEAVERLIQLANEHGGNDNVTVIVAKLTERPPREHGPAVVEQRESPVRDPGGAGSESRGQLAGRLPAPLPRRMVTRSTRLRSLLRTVAFLGLLAGFCLAVVGAIWLYSEHSFFVSVAFGRVAIFQGRQGGVLWFHPHVVDLTSIRIDRLPQGLQGQIRRGVQEGSLAAARSFVRNASDQFATSALARGALG